MIPANTGNIARTCAGRIRLLHLIRPLGFSTDSQTAQTGRVDNWENVKIHYYDSLEEFFERNAGGEFYYLTKFGSAAFQLDYSDQESERFFIFGRETTGLPKDLIQENMDGACGFQ